MTTMRTMTLTLGLALAAAACGGEEPSTGDTRALLCANEARADDFTPGLEKATTEGLFSVRLLDSMVEGEPRSPDRGFNTWMLQVVDGSGNLVDGADVEIRPWMPDHGHGTTPLIHSGAAMTDGYEVGPFDLFMGGFWEFTVTVRSGAAEDEAVFGFCLEG